MLRALGLTRKIRIGFWAWPLIRGLARLRFLRGTPFDPFGLAEVRRLERALPGEYEAAIERLLVDLDEERFEAAVTAAKLPDLVRGYESLKVERVAAFRAALAEAVAHPESQVARAEGN